jgi:NADPH:quinone reductase-like Zn-dependent oxidoreductase
MPAMLALVATADARRAALADVDPPEPRPEEALVAVRAASLNRGEVNNLSRAAPGWRPGWDLAGEVVRSPADRLGPEAGTRVVGLVSHGAWAEQVAVPRDWLAPLPPDVTFEAASTLPVAGITALRALRMGDQFPEKRVLVTGAAGGVGRFGVQLAALWGATVTAVVGSEERGAGLADLGATQVSVGMPSEGAFDLILESVGGESLARALDLLAHRGVVVSYGVSSGTSTTFDPGAFFRKGGTRLVGLLLFEDLRHYGSADLDLVQLVDLLQRRALDPQIGLDVSWHRASEAFEALLQRKVKGKAVIRID